MQQGGKVDLRCGEFLMPLFESAEIKHIVDQTGQTLTLADNRLQIALLLVDIINAFFTKQFGIHTDRGERSFQFV